MLPNEHPALQPLLNNVKHVEGVHFWHPLIHEIHVEDAITISCEASAFTCRKSLCFLCPSPYPFPTRFSENTRVYAPGFGTIAAKMPRINPDPKKNARGKFLWPLGKTLGIYLVGARDIAWDLSGSRLGNRLGFFRWALETSLGI